LKTDIDQFTSELNTPQKVNVKFQGTAVLGKFIERITVTDTICGGAQEIEITGIIEAPDLSVGNLELETPMNTEVSGSITLKANSNRAIIIDSVLGVLPPFMFDQSQLPLTIPAGKDAALVFKYLPEKTEESEIDIKIIAAPCDINAKSIIKGKAYIANAVLKVNDYSAFAGETIGVPILLINQENLDKSNVSSISVDLSFNPTLLYPEGYTIASIDDYTAKIRLTDLPVNISVGDALTNVKFKSALGNAEECALILSNAETIGGKADITLEQGKFTLLGVCREGGTRLINPGGEFMFKNIVPNPAKEYINVIFNLIEKGRIELVLTNILGGVVREISKDVQELGMQSEYIFLEDIPQGYYILRLKTPTMIESKSVSVIK